MGGISFWIVGNLAIAGSFMRRIGLSPSSLQLPSNIPMPFNATGVVAGIVAFFVVTLLTRAATRSRQSWVPGLVFGLLVGYVVSVAYPS